MKKGTNNPLKSIAYNCRRATLLIEKKQSVSLSLREKLELKIHLAGCSICRTYERQSILISQMMHRLFNNKPTGELRLDPDFKAAMQKKIEEKLSDESH
ncbi:hypothetical protein HQ865_12215 [Mucilaginibacter mali]|uniref:Zinc-finger domain-containing protein n=1 Tax=Mucilaginibacter mali TaxID=2740462 RepID=A0A7D4QT79_9SPHI|nr:hypothetical protein [Mucilaginibacter mali]QKJ30489.1 hypothetical protein HQ865_12215 [Mucilaginibacter mali]